MSGRKIYSPNIYRSAKEINTVIAYMEEARSKPDEELMQRLKVKQQEVLNNSIKTYFTEHFEDNFLKTSEPWQTYMNASSIENDYRGLVNLGLTPDEEVTVMANFATEVKQTIRDSGIETYNQVKMLIMQYEMFVGTTEKQVSKGMLN